MRYLLFFCLCFTLTACQEKPKLTEFQKILFEMQFRLLIGDHLSDKQKSEIEGIVTTVFQEVDTVYNNWNPLSELSCLNRLPPYHQVTLSPRLTTLLHLSQTLYILSDGRFDATIEPLQRLWKSYLRQGKLPPEEEIRKIAPAIGWSHIHLDENQFWKDHPETAIDVGALSKGFALDCLTEKLQQLGYSNFYVEWGGEVCTSGHHPSGRSWKVGILGSDVLELNAGAIATSGDYFQCWEVDGEIYFHIIDPRTLYPLRSYPGSIASASVFTTSCALADGLATSLMLFSSSEEASIWADRLKSIRYWIIVRKN